MNLRCCVCCVKTGEETLAISIVPENISFFRAAIKNVIILAVGKFNAPCHASIISRNMSRSNLDITTASSSRSSINKERTARPGSRIETAPCRAERRHRRLASYSARHSSRRIISSSKVGGESDVPCLSFLATHCSTHASSCSPWTNFHSSRDKNALIIARTKEISLARIARHGRHSCSLHVNICDSSCTPCNNF